MIDWTYVFKTLVTVGTGIVLLVIGEDATTKGAGVGIITGALSQGALTANSTLTK